MSKKEKELRKLLKTVNLDKPSAHFTENILELLARDAQVNIQEESMLRSYLDERILPTVSEAFTPTIKTSIENESKEDYVPLLSKKTRMYAFVILIVTCLIASFSSNSITNGFNEQVWLQLPEVSPQISMGILVVFVLLLLDSFIEKRKVI